MDNQQGPPGKLNGALIGGALMGVLSAIPFVNCCCILWGAAGGALAAYLTANKSSSFSAGDGAMCGLISAGIGTVICVVLSIPINMVMQGVTGGGGVDQSQLEELPPAVQDAIASMSEPTSLMSILMSLLIMGAMFGVMSTIGGAITGAVVKKQPSGE